MGAGVLRTRGEVSLGVRADIVVVAGRRGAALSRRRRVHVALLLQGESILWEGWPHLVAAHVLGGLAARGALGGGARRTILGAGRLELDVAGGLRDRHVARRHLLAVAGEWSRRKIDEKSEP
jgi:hypothetical protein